MEPTTSTSTYTCYHTAPAQPSVATPPAQPPQPSHILKVDFKAINQFTIPLKATQGGFPNLQVNLQELSNYLIQHLQRGDYQPDVHLSKELAAQVLGGPPSLHWNLSVNIINPQSEHPLAAAFPALIREVTRNYILQKIPTPQSMDVLKPVYQLDITELGNGWLYRLGPDITLFFHHQHMTPASPSSLDGWTISMKTGDATCKVGTSLLHGTQKLTDAAAQVRERVFEGVDIPDLIVPVLRAMGHGATIRPEDAQIVARQLEGTSLLALCGLWNEFRKSHGPCRREEWIHFLNLLLLVQDHPNLCKKLARMWAGTHTQTNADENIAIAEAIVENPGMTRYLLNEIQGMILTKWCHSPDNADMQLWAPAFITDRRKPRPLAAVNCAQGPRHLWLAAPGDANHPIDVAVRYVESLATLADQTIDRTAFLPVYALFGLVPVTKGTSAAHVTALQDLWKSSSKLRAALSCHYPDTGLEPTRLKRWLKKHERQARALETKEPPAPTEDQEVHKTRRKPRSKCRSNPSPTVTPKAPKTDYAEAAVKEWQALADANAEIPLSIQAVADQMVREWPQMKEITASAPALRQAATQLYADVLMQSYSDNHLERTVSLLIKNPALATKDRQQAILRVLRLVPKPWTVVLQAKIRQLLTALPAATNDDTLNSAFVQHGMQNAIASDDWDMASSYIPWAKERLSKNAHDLHLANIKDTLIQHLQVKVVMDQKATAEQTVAILPEIAKAVPFFHGLDPKATKTILRMLFDKCLKKAYEHPSQITLAVLKLYKAASPLNLFDREDTALCTHYSGLVASVCAHPWDDRCQDQLDLWLHQLREKTNFQIPAQRVAVRAVHFTYFLRKFESILTHPTGGMYRTHALEDFLMKLWTPLMLKMEAEGQVGLALEGMLALCHRVLAVSPSCRMLQRLLAVSGMDLSDLDLSSNETQMALANVDPCLLVKAHQLWDSPDLSCLLDGEREVNLKGAYRMMLSKTKQQIDGLCSDDVGPALAEFASAVIRESQQAMSRLMNKYLDSRTDINRQYVGHAIIVNARMIEFARACWGSTKAMAALQQRHAKLAIPVAQMLVLAQSLGIKIPGVDDDDDEDKKRPAETKGKGDDNRT